MVVARRLHGTGHETVVALEVARAGGQGVEVGEQVRVGAAADGVPVVYRLVVVRSASCVDMLAPPRPNGERLRPKDETPRQALLNKWLRPHPSFLRRCRWGRASPRRNGGRALR